MLRLLKIAIISCIVFGLFLLGAGDGRLLGISGSIGFLILFLGSGWFAIMANVYAMKISDDINPPSPFYVVGLVLFVIGAIISGILYRTSLNSLQSDAIAMVGLTLLAISIGVPGLVILTISALRLPDNT
ncbi:MAG: hypothetical protein WCJ24_00680 [Candidatus Saccharibacteria bacterium]